MGENPHPKPWNTNKLSCKKRASSFAKNPAVLKGPWTKVSPSFGALFSPFCTSDRCCFLQWSCNSPEGLQRGKIPSVTNSPGIRCCSLSYFTYRLLLLRLQQAVAKYLPAYTSLALILLLGEGGGQIQHSSEWNPAVLLAYFQKRFFLSVILSPPIHPQH